MQIYKITNLINGKLYIGQTKNCVDVRWALHLSDFESGRKSKYPLYQAFGKYGIDNFKVEVIHDGITNFDDLDYWERYYIKLLNAKSPNGYNLTDGGQGVHGYHHTDETKRIIGDRVKLNASKIYTDERNHKISIANSGKIFSEEHRRKLSASAKQRVGERNPFYGKHHSADLRRKWSLNSSMRYLQIDRITGDVLNEFECVSDAAKYIQSLHITTAKGSSIAHGIHMCCEGKYRSSCGYKWKSVDKNNKV